MKNKRAIVTKKYQFDIDALDIFISKKLHQEVTPEINTLIYNLTDGDYEMMNKIDLKLYNLFVKVEKEIISFVEKHANKE